MADRTLALLQWLDRHPSTYFWLVAGIIGGLLGRVLVPVMAERRDDSRRHDWWWGGAILMLVVAGRWPSFLYTRELSPDESQLLAGAHALTLDPVFWRSVNGWTAGPLDFFALWPAGTLLGWDTFLTARVTAALLLASTLVLAHQVMARLVGRTAARLASLTAASLEALTHAADFLHYSTELVPVTLLAMAAYAAVRRLTAPEQPLWNGLGGLMLGAVPLAKLQAGPLAALMGLVWLAAEWRSQTLGRPRRLVYLTLGAVLPAATFAVQLAIAGEWRSFAYSYLLFNLQYADAGEATLQGTLMVMFGNSLWWDRLLPVALLACAVWGALMIRLRPAQDAHVRDFTRASVAGCVLAVTVILWPHRPYLHYWQLLLLPGTCLLGVTIARLLASPPPRWRTTERRLVVLGAAGVIGILLVTRGVTPNTFVGDLAYFWHFDRTGLSARAGLHARAGDHAAIWGRADHVYVEANLVQATRDSHGQFLLQASPLQSYFRQRFLADFLHTKPALFIDAVGPTNLYYQTPESAHDRNFPELAGVVAADYALVDQFEGARIYRRRELLTR